MLNSNLNNFIWRYGTFLECYGLEMIYTFQISIETDYYCNGIRTGSFKEEITLLGKVSVFFWEVVLYLPRASCYKGTLMFGFFCICLLACLLFVMSWGNAQFSPEAFKIDCVCVCELFTCIYIIPSPPPHCIPEIHDLLLLLHIYMYI